MPVRSSNTRRVVEEKQSGGKYPKLINLDFLPIEYVKRIDDIFDSYFNLGMKARTSGVDEDTAPMFPTKVSSLNSPELGDVLSKFTAWYSFASDKCKYVTVANNYIETEMQKILDRELGTMVSDKGNIEAKKSQARSSTEYITLISYHQKLIGLKTLLERELVNYDKCIASLSREVSRRENNAGF